MPGAGTGPPSVWVVVPCYNEARRLPLHEFESLLVRSDVAVLFVDDGSRDGTLELLRAFAGRFPRRAVVLPLAANRGKGEAVRAGMLHALAEGAAVVGYLDADLATPPEEVLRLLAALEAGGWRAVLGSRVRLLGSEIRRSALRHYRGRVFATAASLALDLPVYDTQCGAKLFRSCPALAQALASPFRARWAFDVELLGRLMAPARAEGLRAADIVEVPLLRWSDVRGSKLGSWQMLRAAGELLGVALRLRRARGRREKDRTGDGTLGAARP